MKAIRAFVRISALLLLATGAAKLVSSAGAAPVLDHLDPLFSISFRNVFRIVGVLEVLIAAVCFFSPWLRLQVALICWLSTSFVLYRISLHWLGHYKACSCLGTLTEALNITPETADFFMKCILAFLAIGSYAAMFWLASRKEPAPPGAPSSPENIVLRNG